MTFNEVARRKRLDRAMQVAVIGFFLTAQCNTITAEKNIMFIAKALGRRSSTVTGVLAGLVAGVLFSKKAFQLINPEMAPADILAKMKAPITEEKETLNKDAKA